MTSFQMPDILRQHRPLLMALEAIGWLHMTGKAKIDFLKDPEGYKFKEWHQSLQEPLNQTFDWLAPFLQQAYSAWKLPGSPPTLANLLKSMFNDFADFLSKKNPVVFLQAGHAMASGIEKNLPGETSKYLCQDAAHIWLSSAFGKPVRDLLADPPELLTDAGWKRLLGQIERLLIDLKKLGENGSSNDLHGWWCWRESAVGANGWLREAFTSTLAETRLPNNDVTLFDQSYVAAALFKSAVAGAILEGTNFPWQNGNLKQQTQWRLLTVGIGADHYETRAVKIGDWTGTRRALDDFFIKVRKLVEVDLAVGSLLYEDGEVCVFSFPGEPIGHGQLGYQGGTLQIAEWKEWLVGQIDGYADEAKLETPPYCEISEKPSRSLVGMTTEIEQARKTMAVPLYRSWSIKSADHDPSDGHVCPVCLVRCNNKNKTTGKYSKQNPCGICQGRRSQRLKQWENGEGVDTVWISEVADANDRVALVTMSLDIEPWLDGNRLDSLRTQAIPEWREANQTLGNVANQIDPATPFESIFTYIKGKLSTLDKNDPVLRNLQEGYRYESDWPTFFSKIVEDRANAPEWSALVPDGRARWLAHQFFRKLASPGRIYRFQQQAKEFFSTQLSAFRTCVLNDQNGWRFRRLLLKPSIDSPFQCQDRKPYSSRFAGMAIDLLYREKTNDFITISNLARILKKTDDKDVFKGKDKYLELKDDDNQSADRLIVELVEDPPEALSKYDPLIPLEVSPVRFRVLLPLGKASECVDRALAAWQDEFACVWDRLPLRVGVIAFPRKTPFQAVFEMARTVEEKLASTKEEKWRVVGHDAKTGSVSLILADPDAKQETHCIPVIFPSGREDVFYPYLAVEDTAPRLPRDFRHPNKNDRIYRHVKDIRYGDGVSVFSARIHTVFMDDAGCRFEELKQHGLMEWKEMRGLWKRIDRDAPSQRALRGAWSELAERRDGWKKPDGTWFEGGKEAWLDLARAVFHERLGARAACLENLVQAAGDGLLDWCLEWHITVLKMQVSGGAR
ncbi:MAG: CRISPR-associated protein Csx11 [Deltaproteobacteria bacterium]|nr:CRISPR-associated protein Csx11 [Deltaproteobacteria bacterium]